MGVEAQLTTADHERAVLRVDGIFVQVHRTCWLDGQSKHDISTRNLIKAFSSQSPNCVLELECVLVKQWNIVYTRSTMIRSYIYSPTLP